MPKCERKPRYKLETEWHRVTEHSPPEDRDLLVWTGHYMIVSSAHYYDDRQRKEYADLATGSHVLGLTEKDKLHLINCRGRFVEFCTNHYFDNPKVFWAELPKSPEGK